MNEPRHGGPVRPRPGKPKPKGVSVANPKAWVAGTLGLLLLTPGCRGFATNVCSAENSVRTEIDGFRDELSSQLGPIFGGTSSILLYLPFTAAKFALLIGCIGLGGAAGAVSAPFEVLGITSGDGEGAGDGHAEPDVSGPSPLPPLPTVDAHPIE